jgi:hypothetical protein
MLGSDAVTRRVAIALSRKTGGAPGTEAAKHPLTLQEEAEAAGTADPRSPPPMPGRDTIRTQAAVSLARCRGIPPNEGATT